jgi:hypothetical protein
MAYVVIDSNKDQSQPFIIYVCVCGVKVNF